MCEKLQWQFSKSNKESTQKFGNLLQNPTVRNYSCEHFVWRKTKSRPIHVPSWSPRTTVWEPLPYKESPRWGVHLLWTNQLNELVCSAAGNCKRSSIFWRSRKFPANFFEIYTFLSTALTVLIFSSFLKTRFFAQKMNQLCPDSELIWLGQITHRLVFLNNMVTSTVSGEVVKFDCWCVESGPNSSLVIRRLCVSIFKGAFRKDNI